MAVIDKQLEKSQSQLLTGEVRYGYVLLSVFECYCGLKVAPCKPETCSHVGFKQSNCWMKWVVLMFFL